MTFRATALFAALAIVSGPALAAGVNRCTVDGKIVYQDQPCLGAGVATGIQTGPPPKREREVLKVDSTVAKQCFDMYRIHSLDPTEAKMLGYVGYQADAGFPVLNVDAVFRNRAGGPEREMLWCKLTPELQIEKTATDERVLYFMRNRNR